MASSALDIFSGIAAAAAGFAGDKVSKSGSIPGLDLATILPALLGKGGGAAGLVGTLASVASKSGLLNSSNMGKIAELAGSLLSSSAKTTGKTKASAVEGVAGLAAAIMGGGSGKGLNLGSIAKMAAGLAKTAETPKQLNGLASELGKTLSSSFGVSLGGAATALKGLDSVLDKGDSKAALFKSILKGLA